MLLLRFTLVFALLSCFALSVLGVDSWAARERKNAVREVANTLPPGTLERYMALKDSDDIRRATRDLEAKTLPQYEKIRNFSYASYFVLTLVSTVLALLFSFRRRVASF